MRASVTRAEEIAPDTRPPLHEHQSGARRKVVGLETVDPSTEPQLVELAKKYFMTLEPKM